MEKMLEEHVSLHEQSQSVLVLQNWENFRVLNQPVLGLQQWDSLLLLSTSPMIQNKTDKYPRAYCSL
jgi:hypothetical protein